MNATIELLKEHRSFREFDTSYLLPEIKKQAIIDAARQAPSWMNGQFYSIMILDDLELRQKLVEWNPGSPQILNCSVFLLFIGDLHRSKLVSEHYQQECFIDQGVESVLLATTDAALALQNAIIATESLGLGAVPVGSVRKDAPKISKLLQLPPNTFPLFGLCIGKPTVEMNVKPRLPEKAVVHYNQFQSYDYQLLEQYDQQMTAFGEVRETKLWTQKFADYFAQQPLFITDQYLYTQGFLKHQSKET